MRDRREEVLLKITFLIEITWGLVASLFAVFFIEEYFVRAPLEPSIRLALTLKFFLCGFGIVWLNRQRKKLSLGAPGALVYEHSIRREEEASNVFSFSRVWYFLFLIFYLVFQFWSLSRERHGFWFLFSCSVLFAVLLAALFFMALCRYLCSWRYEPIIKVDLYERKLSVTYSHAHEYFSIKNASFTLSEITVARVVTAEDQEIRQHVIKLLSRKLDISTNVKLLYGYYLYAFFLGKEFPLPDGNQVVELKLQSGRHVLIETDDAENFIAALKRGGVGGGTASSTGF